MMCTFCEIKTQITTAWDFRSWQWLRWSSE